ncbi:MAG: energy transducer TonB [Pseudomonadota bacterium]
MSHAAFSPHTELDRGRIAAISGAVLVNALLFLLLLAPMTPPAPSPHADDTLVIPIVERARPVPPPPRPVPVERPRPVRPMPERVHRPQPVPPPAAEPATDPQPGDLPAQPTDAASGAVATTLEPEPPGSGTHLAYRHAPPPPYPPQAVRQGLTGSVLLRVTVDIDGTPIEAAIERSSGHRLLDQAARRHVLARWRFEPAMRDGMPIRAVGLVPVDFVLER